MWLAASTHEGEEAICIDSFKALQKDHLKQLLLLVPRHPQRFAAVADLLTQSGLRFARRSLGETVSEDTQVLLVDTLGELMLFYAMSDVAFVGGSLVPIGGHNLLEPAALSKPVLTGPYCASQQQLCDYLEARQALLRVQDAADLQRSLARLLADAQARHAMGAAAFSVVEANRGSLARIEGAVARVMVQRQY